MLYPKMLELSPRKGARGVVALPGSKSISNRMLLLAALATGTTRLTHVLESDDTAVMIDSLQKLGVDISVLTPGSSSAPASGSASGSESVSGSNTVVIKGTSGRFTKTGSKDAPVKLFIGNSGLTIRTLLPALVASMSQTGGCVEISGVERMHERPIKDLVDGLTLLGASIEYLGKDGFPPLRIHGVQLQPKDLWEVKGSTSSQFLTGLMQAAPLLATQWNKTIRISVIGKLISKPYVEITRATLKKFGVEVAQETSSIYAIRPQPITSPEALIVEGDASSASYFLAAGLLGGGPVRVVGAGKESVQGDVHFADALAKMGASVSWGPDWIEAKASEKGIHGATLDCNAIPDAAMTLAVVALFAKGPTKLLNIGSWRVKETDRIAAMANECRKLGATVREGDDFIEIHPVETFQPAEIETYDDHRVAMCFSLASFGSQSVRIKDPGCVAKTFPDYFEVFSDICARATPVIAIDGPTASGKGTIASLLAQELGFRYLDSGALYRLAALAAQKSGADISNESALAAVAQEMKIEFSGQTIRLEGQDVTEAIRAEAVGLDASKIAVYPSLRRALLLRQRDFARQSGLVADGRDMGSVVFPGAALKVFLTATPHARAQRRYKQLIDKGFSCNLDGLSADLAARDARDQQRPIAPLKPASDALVVDSTDLPIDQVVQVVLKAWRQTKA